MSGGASLLDPAGAPRSRRPASPCGRRSRPDPAAALPGPRLRPGRPGAPAARPPAPARPRPVPLRGRTHRRRRHQLLRLRPFAGEGRRPRLHERVHPLRADRSRWTSRCPRSPACAGRSSRWARARVRAVLPGRGGRGPGARARPARAVDLSGYGDVPRATRWRSAASCYGFAAVLLIHAAPAPALRARDRRCWPRCSLWLATFLHWYMIAAAHVVPRRLGVPRPPSCSSLWDRGRGPRAAPRLPRPGPAPGPRHVPALAERRLPAPARPRAPAARSGARACRCAEALRSGGLLARGDPRGRAAADARLEGALRRLPAARSRRTEPTSCASTIPSCSRPSSPPATACCPGRPCSGPASWASCPSLKRRPALALPLLPPLLVMTYVNMCSGDWWAGGSFSNRRFDSLLPVFALGSRPRSSRGPALLRRRPELGAGPGRRALRARGTRPSSSRCAAASCRATTPWTGPCSWASAAQLVSDAVGFPTTWPASWIFAGGDGPLARPVRPARSAATSSTARTTWGASSTWATTRAPMLGEGWGRPQREDGPTARASASRGQPRASWRPSTCPRTWRSRCAPPRKAGATPGGSARERPARRGASRPGRGWREPSRCACPPPSGGASSTTSTLVGRRAPLRVSALAVPSDEPERR